MCNVAEAPASATTDIVVTAIISGIFGALVVALMISDYIRHRRRAAAPVKRLAEPDIK